jgi:hypothetical protein
MAAANESQGLKIAVAAFVSLTVVLAVTSYFLYSSYAQTYDKLDEAQKKLGTTNSALDKMNRDYVDFRTRAGYGKLVEGQEWQVEVKKDQDKANAKLADATKAVADMVAEARKQGATDPRLADLTQRTELIVQDFLDEKKATFASSIDRLVELVSNLAQLTAAFSLDNIDLRSKLNSVDSINRGTVDAQEKVVQATRADLEKVQADHEQDRQALVTKLDQFQTLNSQLASENATLKTQLAQREEEAKKQLADVSGSCATPRPRWRRPRTSWTPPTAPSPTSTTRAGRSGPTSPGPWGPGPRCAWRSSTRAPRGCRRRSPRVRSS